MADVIVPRAVKHTHESLPYQDGFYMPAEWHPHTRCWIIWPCRPDNWRHDAQPAREAFREVIRAISRFERVAVCVPAAHMDSANTMLAEIDNVEIHQVESDDSWIRDTGPTFVIGQNKELRGVNWFFNAWGGVGFVNGINYVPWEKDKYIAHEAIAIAGASKYRADFILEGGSIHVDGEGTVLTTKECLLNPNRNPLLTREDIEKRLRSYLGIRKVIWLPRGLYADEDTNGHIDNFACFVRPGVVLLAWTDDASDPQYEISREAYDVLSTTKDALGRSLEIIKIPTPPPMYYSEEDCLGRTLWGGHNPREPGARMAGSYVNFYLANGGIVCPSFHPETDAIASKILSEAHPDRKVVFVPGREILLGGGNIHCITQQEPVPI